MATLTSHYWEGDRKNIVAFVFSTPGRIEDQNGRPVSGDTGRNMDAILSEMHTIRPDLFPMVNRYYYRITNSSMTVMYAGADNGQTEGNDRRITEASNIKRVLNEIGDCSVVILCGKKAQKLKDAIKDKIVVTSCHFGNKGLRNKYLNRHEEMLNLRSAKERDAMRQILCARSIVNCLTISST